MCSLSYSYIIHHPQWIMIIEVNKI
jgi:hypothetical protein